MVSKGHPTSKEETAKGGSLLGPGDGSVILGWGGGVGGEGGAIPAFMGFWPIPPPAHIREFVLRGK